MSEWIPTTEQIMRGFCSRGVDSSDQRSDESFSEFLERVSVETNEKAISDERAARRWLAQYDRDLAAKVFRAAVKDMEESLRPSLPRGFVFALPSNPYAGRKTVADVLRETAKADAHDREVAARTLREAADARILDWDGGRHAVAVGHSKSSAAAVEHDADIAWLRARADKIEEEA